jgi:hypothetical protein
MFLDLPDPHPDPLVTSTDPDSSIIKRPGSRGGTDHHTFQPRTGIVIH